MTRYFLIYFFIISIGNLQAQVAPPPCFDQIATTFFPNSLVIQAAIMHKITTDRGAIIANELQARSAQVPLIARQRASQLVPNPLQPFQPIYAAALLRSILEEIFSQTMQANFFYDSYGIQTMFRFIREQQAERLLPCFGYGPLVDPPLTR